MKINFTSRSIPVAILAACCLAYGLLIPWLGFYWDDWPTLWFLNRFGPSIFSTVYGVDRPALGWLFTVTTALVGQSPLAWQIFGILTRWLACLSLWWMLRSIWPHRTLETAWVAFLFALYPGFKQHAIAFTYSADWIAISLFFFSFYLMVIATRLSKWSWFFAALSWVLSAYVMFADEYYFGLELLRPVFLWYAFGLIGIIPRQRFGRIMGRWLPYLAIMGSFLFWRLVIFSSPRGQFSIFDQLSSNTLTAILNLGGKVFRDLIQSSVGAQLQIIDLQSIFSLKGLDLIIYISLAVLSALLAYLYFRSLNLNQRVTDPAEKQSQLKWAVQAILIGGFALLIGGWPFWVTDLPMGLSFPWDRFNLAMMFGTSLAFTGLIVWLLRTPNLRALAFGIILGLTVSFHLRNLATYRTDWELQKTFFWQLAWRAPSIEPGTLVITAGLPFKYFSDNSLTAPLNLIYAPQNTTTQMSYMLYAAESRLRGGLADFSKGQPIYQPYRAASFTGNSDQAIVLFFDPSHCLKLIDSELDLNLPNKPDFIDQAIPLSNLKLLGSSSATKAYLPEQFFGEEPEPDWCYYFQKIDLARQSGDWQEAARLAELANPFNQPIQRGNAYELAPFIAAYGMTGQWDKAIRLSELALEANPKIGNYICPIWYDVWESKKNGPGAQLTFDKVVNILNCTFGP